MINFFLTNWIWILFIGGMPLTHLGHGGCGGHGGAPDQSASNPGQRGSDVPPISLSKTPGASGQHLGH